MELLTSGELAGNEGQRPQLPQPAGEHEHSSRVPSGFSFLMMHANAGAERKGQNPVAPAELSRAGGTSRAQPC